MKECFESAKACYASLGVDVEAALKRLSEIPVSLHCWQGDDVAGFENAGSLDGGLAVTGNYPGRARNAEELRADIAKVLTLVPGRTQENDAWGTRLLGLLRKTSVINPGLQLLVQNPRQRRCSHCCSWKNLKCISSGTGSPALGLCSP